MPPGASGREGERIVVGRVLGPHGLAGWVKVESFTDPPEEILALPCWRTADGRELRPVEGRRQGRFVVARLDGVEDRTAAEALGKPEVWVLRRELPALEEGEHYRADLIGLEVVNLEGRRLGRVDHFLDLPANPVMVVAGEREHWLPIGKGQLLRVDLVAGRLTVDWDPEF